jgi:hypothetical protein
MKTLLMTDNSRIVDTGKDIYQYYKRVAVQYKAWVLVRSKDSRGKQMYFATEAELLNYIQNG